MLLGLLIFVGVCPDSTVAQTAAKTVNGGVVNGRATKLPKPEYPASLREAGVEGTVVVNIVIDENGSVTSAVAELNDQRVRKTPDGNVSEPTLIDPQLRDSAEAAAREAKFEPTRLGGEPVIVKGKIVYSFVAKPEAAPTVESRTISGGVLNGKALSLPLPKYPAAAMAVNASGSVSIQVAIDEEGNVVAATAVSGHPLLRSAAEAAAMEAKFSRTFLAGNPVRVSGVLVYSFTP